MCVRSHTIFGPLIFLNRNTVLFSFSKSCAFTIQRNHPTICKMELEFIAFDWGQYNNNEEGTQECEDAALTVILENGKLDTFCGDSFDASNGTIEVNLFENDQSIELIFNRFGNRSKDGGNYNVTVRQIVCSDEGANLISTRDSLSYPEYDNFGTASLCGQTIQKQEFVLQSPNYPRNYDNNLDCYIRILPSDEDICSLELRFDEFRLHTSSFDQSSLLCPNDYLQISDIDNSGNPQRYCDVFTGIRLVEMTTQGKEFHFSTDEEGREVGYSIQIRQLRCDLQPVPTTTTEIIDGRTSSTASAPSTAPPPISTTNYSPCPVTSNPFLTTTSKPFYSTTTASVIRPRYCSEVYELNSLPIAIQSLGYPEPLRGGGCFYSVKTISNVCSVQLDFKQFAIGTFSAGECLNGYMLVNGEQRVCGLQSGKTLLFPVRESQVTVEIVTPLGLGYPGYELTMKPIFCSISRPSDDDSYGAPQAPVINSNDWTPIYNDKPDYTPPLYYPPPTSRPDYASTYKPSYHRPSPSKPHRDWFAPIRKLIRAKQRALRSLFGVFGLHPRPVKRPFKPSYGTKPHYKPRIQW